MVSQVSKTLAVSASGERVRLAILSSKASVVAGSAASAFAITVSPAPHWIDIPVSVAKSGPNAGIAPAAVVARGSVSASTSLISG